MSEPVSNAEIEDVLSSIRRLVSEDIMPVKRNHSAVKSDQTLVLTPAFRVAENQDAAPEPEATDAGDETAAVVEGDSAAGVMSGSDETPDAALARAHEEETFHFHEDTVPETTETAEDVAEESAAELQSDEGRNDDDQAAGPPAPAPHATELERTIAGLEAAVGLQGGEWEPDGSEIDSEAPDEAVPLSVPLAEDQAAPAADAEPDEAVVIPAAIPAAIPFVHAARTLAEAPVPDLRQPAGPAETEASVESVADADGVTDADAESGADADVDADAAAADDAVLIDEEALRELVSEIVYRELQGALGERITRNVRKLVRREIHRVLISHDFE